MAPFIFGDRNGIHIMDLSKTVPMLHQALVAVKDVVASGGRVLFVGTKRQASGIIEREAIRCGMPFVSERWLGGTLTNFKTVKNSIQRLHDLEQMIEDGSIRKLNKREALDLYRERDKLERGIGGISNWDQVRCLHTQYAHHLSGDNVIGQWLDREYDVADCLP